MIFRTLIFAGGGCFGFSYTYIVFLGFVSLGMGFSHNGFSFSLFTYLLLLLHVPIVSTLQL